MIRKTIQALALCLLCVGPLAAQMIMSSPEIGASTVRTMYYLSIICARRSVWRQGRFVLGLLDVIVARWRGGVLRRPRPPLTPTGGCRSRMATAGEQSGHLCRVDILQ